MTPSNCPIPHGPKPVQCAVVAFMVKLMRMFHQQQSYPMIRRKDDWKLIVEGKRNMILESISNPPQAQPFTFLKRWCEPSISPFSYTGLPQLIVHVLLSKPYQMKTSFLEIRTINLLPGIIPVQQAIKLSETLHTRNTGLGMGSSPSNPSFL